MKKNIMDFYHFTIHATDGDIGSIEDIYFDDATWTIRYLVVQTGSWLSDQRVLISPISVQEVDCQNRKINVSLNQKQIKNCPSIDTAKPVSRQYEIEFFNYYGWDYYWMSPGIWSYKMTKDEDQDPHLRSVKEVTGYHLSATNGEIGHVEDFLFDSISWQIENLIVDTMNWWLGKKVIVSLDRIKSIKFDEKIFEIDMECESIRSCPEYDHDKAKT